MSKRSASAIVDLSSDDEQEFQRPRVTEKVDLSNVHESSSAIQDLSNEDDDDDQPAPPAPVEEPITPPRSEPFTPPAYWPTSEKDRYIRSRTSYMINQQTLADELAFLDHLKFLLETSDRALRNKIKDRIRTIKEEIQASKIQFFLCAETLMTIHHDNERMFNKVYANQHGAFHCQDMPKFRNIRNLFPNARIKSNHDLDLFFNSFEELQTTGDYDDLLQDFQDQEGEGDGEDDQDQD